MSSNDNSKPYGYEKYNWREWHTWSEEYDEIYWQVCDIDSLTTYKNNLKDSLDKAISLKDRIYDTISNASMRGQAATELKMNVMTLFEDNIVKTQEVICDKLEFVKSECDAMKTNMEEWRKEDKQTSWYDTFVASYKDTYGYDMKQWSQEVLNYFNQKTSEWSAQIHKISNIRDKVDENLKNIREFNDMLEDFSIALITFEYVIDDYGDYTSLNVEKMKTLISDYERLYYEKKKHLKSNEKEGFVAILKALGYPYEISFDGSFNYDEFMKLHAFLNTPLTRNDWIPSQIIYSYFVNGDSWESSGMAALVQLCGKADLGRVGSYASPDYEAQFWANLIYELDGHELDNNPVPLFLFSTDYYKEHGGCTDFSNIYDILFVDDIDPEYYSDYAWIPGYLSSKGQLGYKNLPLFDSLKKSFIEQGYMDGFDLYEYMINETYDNYGTDVLPFLEALDGRIDWTDNNAVIPKEAILSYLNGASWEESELSLYCSKSESEFIAALSKTGGKDYNLSILSAEAADYKRGDLGSDNSSYGISTTRRENIFAGCSTPDELRARLKERGVDTKLGNYYDSIDERNDQIDQETLEMYGIASSIRTLREEVAKTDPKAKTANDILRDQNKAKGKEMAEQYFSFVEGVSGKSEHVQIMTQDEYFAQKQRENPSITREEALREYTDAWKAEYARDLVNNRGYNPECAKRMAEAADYSDKQIVKYDDLDAAESVVYFGREAASDLVVLATGLTSGGADIGRNLKHVVAPDAVPTALQYMQDEIYTGYNDPNSPYYDPLKGSIYSVSRTVVREGTDDILKMIPQTHTIGVALEFLEKYGGNVQSNYEITGNIVAAHGYAATNAVADAATAALTNSVAGGDAVVKTVGNAIASEAKLFVKEGSKAVFGMQSFEDAQKHIEDGQFGIAVNAVVDNIPGASFELTGNDTMDHAINAGATAVVKELTRETANAIYHDDISDVDLTKVAKTGLTSAVTSVTKDVVFNKVNQKNVNRELKTGYVYKDKDGVYRKVTLDGEDEKIEDIKTYVADTGMDAKAMSKGASNVAKTASNAAADSTIKTLTAEVKEDNNTTVTTGDDGNIKASLDNVSVDDRIEYEENKASNTPTIDPENITASLEGRSFKLHSKPSEEEQSPTITLTASASDTEIVSTGQDMTASAETTLEVPEGHDMTASAETTLEVPEGQDMTASTMTNDDYIFSSLNNDTGKRFISDASRQGNILEKDLGTSGNKS